MLRIERQTRLEGFGVIAGVDEAGRGPLAGPVVAAAVVLPEDIDIPGLTDSKQLTKRTREKMFETVQKRAKGWSVGVVDSSTIDSINILQATRLAMLKAVDGLDTKPDCVLIDGNQPIDWNGRQKTVVKGDSLSLSIAAASVIAKVTRDRMMEQSDVLYPGYGFGQHKGYGSAYHREAIAKLGPCPIHRKTFRGVREHLDKIKPRASDGSTTFQMSFLK